MNHLFLIRIVTLSVEILFLLFGYFYLYFDLNIIAILLILLMQFLIIYFQKTSNTENQLEQFSYLTLDSLAILELIYFTGGITNPFISLLLIPIGIGMITLSKRYIIPIVLISIIGYSLLYRYFIPIKLRQNEVLTHLDGIDLHLIGMWASFVFSVLILVYFVYNLVKDMRQKELKLSQLNQKMLRNEQLITVSMLSAGAGHQLNTPLNSMKLIVDLLQQQFESDDEIHDDFNLLNAQIDVCKSIVQKLLHQNYAQPTAISIKDIIKTIQDQWLIFRPTYHIIYKINDEILNNNLLIDEGFYQAIFNLLNNAFESTLEHLPVELLVNHENYNIIYFSIKDQGEGFSKELLSHLGYSRIQDSDKNHSNGWGLLVSYASIERLGGQVFIQKNSDKGTEIRIKFPKI